MVEFGERDTQQMRQLPDEKHPAFQYLAHLGPGSQRTMTEALSKIARLASDGRCDTQSLPWHTLRREQTFALRNRLAATLAPATTNKHLAALRGVLKQARNLGLIDADDYRRAIDLPAVHGPAPRKSRSLSHEELSALVATCDRDTSPAGARDAALFALLFGAGMRRSEVVALTLADYERTSGALQIRGLASRTPRRYTASAESRASLEKWIDRRGAEPGPLFNPINKGGRIEIRGLSEQAIYIACRKRAAEAGLQPVTPEDLRRSLRVRLASIAQEAPASAGAHFAA